MRICHATINKISFERRIYNQAYSAGSNGYKVWIVAAGSASEKVREKRSGLYLRRLRRKFDAGGPWMFVAFNIKLFFCVLLKPIQIIHCHDLWVLPACAFAALLKNCALVYDAHEYYAGLEIFTNRPLRKRIWLLAEWLAMPIVDTLITVSEPLGDLFSNHYPHLKKVKIIRNLPQYELPQKDKQAIQFEKNDKIKIVFHGHFKPGRGLKQLINVVGKIENVQLLLIGGGELTNNLHQLVEKNNLQKRVFFNDYVATEMLISTLAQADIGVVLFEQTSINYSFALPNKFFEYIMAGVPVLSSNIETLQSYIEKYHIGMSVNPADENALQLKLAEMCSDKIGLQAWRKNALSAAKELNWEAEEKKLMDIYAEVTL